MKLNVEMWPHSSNHIVDPGLGLQKSTEIERCDRPSEFEDHARVRDAAVHSKHRLRSSRRFQTFLAFLDGEENCQAADERCQNVATRHTLCRHVSVRRSSEVGDAIAPQGVHHPRTRNALRSALRRLNKSLNAALLNRSSSRCMILNNDRSA